jgi:SNF2 family DNA or RNA helicase
MSVRATTDGKLILVRFPYSERLVDLIHTVPGARWHKPTTTWRCPLVMGSAYALRRAFGRELEVMPPLSAWARGELDRLAEIQVARSSERADLPRVRELAPEMALAMASREYQTVGARVMADAGAMLLGDDPGLGKTIQTLGALIEKGSQSILVFCPRTATRSVWAAEVAHWAPHFTVYVAQGSRGQRDGQIAAWRLAQSPKILICNLEMMRVVKERCPDGPLNKCKFGGETATHKHEHDIAEWPSLHRLDYDAIVADESHKALATTKNTMSKNITQIRYGAMKLRKRLLPGGLAIALSGTPYRSKRFKIWGTMNWLRPDIFTSYWAYASRNFVIDDSGRYGSGEVLDRLIVPDEQWAAELLPYYLGRDKATVAPDLPPIVYAGTPLAGGNYVVLPMDGKQAGAYSSMKKDAEVTLDSGRLTATGVLAEITRMRQFANAYGRLVEGRKVIPAAPSNKLDWILQFMEEHEGSEGKVVIASMFTSMVDLIAAELDGEGYEVLTLTGETSDRDRETLVRRFQDPDDKARVAVINMMAGGVAITLDAADYMVLVDQPWTSDDEKQVVDRIHRVSRIHNVIVYRLVTEGTVDEWIANMTDEQRDNILQADAATRATLLKEAVK